MGSATHSEYELSRQLTNLATYFDIQPTLQGEFTYLGDTWVLDVESMTWQEVRCRGQLPIPRYGHCCHLVGSRMFVIGGMGHHGHLYRDVHFLDLVDWTWVPVNATSTGPSPRQVALAVEGRLVRTSIKLAWTTWIVPALMFVCRAKNPRRFWQASVLVGHKIIIHGGWNGKDRCFGDLWLFDTDSFAWMQPRTGGLPPTER